MEHTLQAYAARRSSSELLCFLESCMLQNQWAQYVQTVLCIFEILKCRGVWIPAQIQASWDAYTKTIDGYS